MSRFEEIINEAIDEVVLGESLKAEGLAAHIAEHVRERQQGMRAEVRIAARYPETVPTPVSGLETQEIYTLLGTAVVSERGTRTLTGIEAQGMTACPCAQELVAGGRARAPRRGRLRRRRDRAHPRPRPGRDPQSARDRLAAPRPAGGRRGNRRRARSAAHRRAVDELGDLRADEALRRARRGREGAHAAALRRGLRAGDDPARRRGLSGARRRRASCTRARRTWRRSTVTRSSPSAPARLGEIIEELRSGERSRHHTTMREWLEAPCGEAEASASKA